VHDTYVTRVLRMYRVRYGRRRPYRARYIRNTRVTYVSYTLRPQWERYCSLYRPLWWSR